MKYDEIINHNDIIHNVDLDDNKSLSEELGLFWKYFLGVVLPQNSHIEWDVVKLEIWADSGCFFVYPGLKSDAKRIEKSCCRLYCRAIEIKWKIAEDAEIPDVEFDAFVKSLDEECASFLNESYDLFVASTDVDKPELIVLNCEGLKVEESQN